MWPEPDFPRTPTMKVRRRSVLDYLRKGGEREEATALAREEASRMRQLVAEMAGLTPAKLEGSSELGVDLGMDSIELLDLVSRVEQEIGVDLPEEKVTAETTVEELERLVERGRDEVAGAAFPWWSLSPPVRALRRSAQRRLLFPLLRLFCRLDVRGVDNVKRLSGPHLLAANHASLLDAPVILMALPPGQRDRTAVAAWAEYFERRGRWLSDRLLRRSEYYLLAALLGIFPLPQTRLFRPSLRYAGELVDRGWNVLIFPEGSRTRTGEMGHFKEGVGVMASRLRVPVVPVKVEGLFEILPSGRRLLRPGPAAVRFGPPLSFPSTASYLEMTRRIEEAVRAL